MGCEEISNINTNIPIDKIMHGAALRAMENVLDLIPVDNVLIVTDIHSDNVASAFYNSACSIGCRVTKFVLDENSRPLNEIPDSLLELLTGKTIVLNIIKALSKEVSFRIKWLIKIEEMKSIRCAHMPGINETVMKNGAMDIDYPGMQSRAIQGIQALNNAEHIHITSTEGTDLVLGVINRPFVHDVHIKSGEMCNFPCGEIYCAPEENRADGVLVIDASIGDIGLIEIPLLIEIINGKIVSFESKDENLVRRITALTDIDEYSKIIGELGIGINPGAKITGNMLEDEKALRTAHIAFGNNEDFPGGKNYSKIHRDYLFYEPDIKVFYLDGSHKFIMHEGQFLI